MLQLPGDPEIPTPLVIPVPMGSGMVKATWAVVEGSTPATQDLPVQNSVVQLSLTSTPVFLERLP